MYISIMDYMCVTDGFSTFKKGKIYSEYKTRVYNILYLINDLGKESSPAIWGFDGPGNKVIYFVELNEWRDKQIDKLI